MSIEIPAKARPGQSDAPAAEDKSRPFVNGNAASSSSEHELPPDAHISPTASISYWSSTPSTVSGMLGGYPQVSRIDIAGSRAFLSKLRRSTASSKSSLPPPPSNFKLVADCGAGIGRITTNFLITVAEHVDVIEPVAKFTDRLREENPTLFEGEDPVVANVFNFPLETWTPPRSPRRMYDVIWNQWCLGHLNDDALVKYLERLRPHVVQGGFIVVKENLSTDISGEDVYDSEDSSVTRSSVKFEKIYEEAGLKVVRMELQKGGFGKGLGLMPVKMWALQPKQMD